MSIDPQATRLLFASTNGEQTALTALMPVLYEELRRTAERYLRGELSTPVHDVYLQQVVKQFPDWNSRSDFFAAAAKLMRQTLVDRARIRRTAKSDIPGLPALDDALHDLAAVDPLKCQIIELRFFGGLGIEEIAHALNISRAAVSNDLRVAKAFLYRQNSPVSTQIVTAGQWRDVQEVLLAAMDLPEPEQRSCVSRMCEGRPAIRAEAECLLAADLQAGDFIEAAIAGEVGRDLSLTTPLISRRIGPYRLVKELGRGGMATVYLGERDDGQFAKDVAVKLIGSMTQSAESQRRFEEERQILATLEHPNIARLLDGGVTEDRLPYIIMEYIEGLPIDEYCNRNGLTLAQRLRLFQTICSTVYFAHQHLVVHRDIKPGNILVTADGVPKLLDFGIAKILNPVLESQPAPTLMPAMTLDYASPEQVQGGIITTSSDVYSLGVLLYELLAGHRPYQLTGTPLSEAVRIVSEQDPEKPSAGAERPELRGDLDAVVLKAMRKDPGQRYTSADEFSSDIGRYLSNRPVLAQRVSARYVVRKFVARHKFAIAASAVATILTLAGVAGVIVESRIARVERAKAERRFNDVRRLANSLIFEMHDRIAGLPHSTEVRQLLVTRALEYLDSLAKEARGDNSLQLELASAYIRVGDVQGGPSAANLGDTKGAFSSYEKARVTLQAVLARSPGDTEARIRMAILDGRLSSAYLFVRDLPRALGAAKEELSGWEAAAGKSADKQESAYGIAGAHCRIAQVLMGLKPDEALSEFQAALKIHEGLLAASPENASDQRNVALDHKYLCNLYEDRDVAKAAEHCQLAVDLDEKRAAANSANLEAKQDLGYSLSQSGTIYKLKGDLPAALQSFNRSLIIRQNVADADPQNVRARASLLYPRLVIGEILKSAGKAEEARSQFGTVVRLGEALIQKNPADNATRERIARAYQNLGELDVRLAHLRPACSEFEHAREMYSENVRRGTASKELQQDALEWAEERKVCAHAP